MMAASAHARILRGLLILLALTLWALLMVARLGFGAAPRVTVQDAWARPGPKGGNSAIYFTLTNEGKENLVLVGAASDVAEEVSIHETVMLPAGGSSQKTGAQGGSAPHHGGMAMGGMMTMRPIPSLTIKAGETVSFKPGGLHVMLMNLRRPLAVGDRFSIQLRFEGQEPLQVPVQVRLEGAPAPHGKAHGK